MKLYNLLLANVVRLMMIIMWLPVTVGIMLGHRGLREWYPSVKQSNQDWIKYFKNPLQP